MKSTKVNTILAGVNSEQTEQAKAEQTEQVKAEQTEQAEQLSLDTVDEVSVAIANSRFASLKNRDLAIAGLALDANSARTFETVREKCKLYGQILKGEMWKEDGYKNFKDCADKLFHDNKGVAYMQAKVGSRFYADNATAIAHQIGEYLSYSVLDKLDVLKDEELKKNLFAILKTDEDGKVIGAITQKDADELAKRVVASRSQSTGSKGDEGSAEGGNGAAAEVVKMYDFKGYRIKYEPKDGTDEVIPALYTFDRKNVTADTISDYVKSDAKEHLFKFKTCGYHVAITEDGAIVVYTKVDHIEPKAEPVKPNMTAFKYDGIARGHANKVPADVVAMMLELDVETVQKVYESLDRAEEVKAGKSAE